MSCNVYFGARPIAAALQNGAQIVVTGEFTQLEKVGRRGEFLPGTFIFVLQLFIVPLGLRQLSHTILSCVSSGFLPLEFLSVA